MTKHRNRVRRKLEIGEFSTYEQDSRREDPVIVAAAERLAHRHLENGGSKLPHHEHAAFFEGIPMLDRDFMRWLADRLVRDELRRRNRVS